MPLVAESAWSVEGAHGGGDDTEFTMTFDLDFPPQAAFIKVALSQYFQWIDSRTPGSASTGLVNMRRRKPDNSDETITFPNIETDETVYVMFDPTMTHVTFGITVRECIATLVWTLGVWE